MIMLIGDKMKKNNVKLNIAMLGHKRIPSREGGIEIVVEELATRMAALGYNVTCYNRSGKHVMDKNQEVIHTANYKGVEIKRVPTIDKKGLAAVTSSLFATIRILFSKADVVHYHAEGTCVWMWIIKIFSRKKIITTIHGLDWQRAKWGNFASKYIKIGEKLAVKYSDEIIVLSENLRDYFYNEYKRNTTFIPNGVSKPKLLETNIIQKRFNLKKNDYILYLGRIVPEKGIHYLIKAYSKIKTNKKLVIAGASSDSQEYFDELLDLSKNMNNIIFTGFVQGDELVELYSNAYIYCLPSDLEGMPLSLLEAMSYGNCCLTSDIYECSSVIENVGLTFKKSDVKDLAKKLQELLDNSEYVNNIKKQSQKFVLNKYDWDAVVDKTIALYEKGM